MPMHAGPGHRTPHSHLYTHGCSGLAAEGEQAQPNAHGRLNPAAVKQFLGMLQQLEPAFFTDGELLQENEWLDAVPARAADSRDSG